MKVAILADGIPPMVMGGMQKHSYYLAKYLALQGVSVELHTMVWNVEDLEMQQPFDDNELKNISVITHVFPTSAKFPGHYVFNSFRLSRRYFKAIENRLHEFDFIYTKGFTGWELLRKRNGRYSGNIGVKFHGMNMFLPTYGFKQRMEQLLLRPPARWILKRADKVFSYGGRVTDVIIGIGVKASKIIEIPTGIESEWVRSEIKVTHDDRRIVFVGRYDPVKGIRELNDVLSQGSFAQLKFDFVGPFEPSDQVSISNAHYHGKLDDPEQMKVLLDRADALILPSYSEGMPNVVLEAMARGLVVLATNVGAIGKMVDSNGYLIDQVSPQGISYLLTTFQEASSDEIDAMKRRSLQKVNEEFLWSGISRLLKDSLKEISK